jgi:hypothetical protein
MAKRSGASVDRSAKLAELQEIVEQLEANAELLDEQGEQRDLLESVTEGLYEETDKLSKKAPGEQVTELLLDQVNQVIGETKELIEEDPYVQRMNQFVPAGDRPEHRDVVVILRMVLQGLKRFSGRLTQEVPLVKQRIKEAEVLVYATEYYQQNGAILTKGQLNRNFARQAEAWFVGEDEHFDFEDLDKRSLKEYFDLE